MQNYRFQIDLNPKQLIKDNTYQFKPKTTILKHPDDKDKTTAGYWACRIGRYPNLTGGKSKFTWW